MNTTPVHIHKSKAFDNTNIILLLIPALIFFLVITIYTITFQTLNPSGSVASTTQTNVLGEDQFDNSEINYLK